MLTLFDRPIGHAHWAVAVSERADGDVHPLRVRRDVLAVRQLDLTGRRWAMSDQVHGVEIADVDDAEGAWPLVGVADVLVARRPGIDVAIWTADCAPVFLLDGDGGVVAFHAGWRGIAAGIVDRAVEHLRPKPAGGVLAVVGPTIGPCCYEFGRADAERVARGAGVAVDRVVRPAPTGDADRVRLDVPEVLRLALARHDVAWSGTPACTACSGDWFSHRARTEAGRHATIARSRPVTDGGA